MQIAAVLSPPLAQASTPHSTAVPEHGVAPFHTPEAVSSHHISPSDRMIAEIQKWELGFRIQYGRSTARLPGIQDMPSELQNLILKGLGVTESLTGIREFIHDLKLVSTHQSDAIFFRVEFNLNLDQKRFLSKKGFEISGRQIALQKKYIDINFIPFAYEDHVGGWHVLDENFLISIGIPIHHTELLRINNVSMMRFNWENQSLEFGFTDFTPEQNFGLQGNKPTLPPYFDHTPDLLVRRDRNNAPQKHPNGRNIRFWRVILNETKMSIFNHADETGWASISHLNPQILKSLLIAQSELEQISATRIRINPMDKQIEFGFNNPEIAFRGLPSFRIPLGCSLVYHPDIKQFYLALPDVAIEYLKSAVYVREFGYSGALSFDVSKDVKALENNTSCPESSSFLDVSRRTEHEEKFQTLLYRTNKSLDQMLWRPSSLCGLGVGSPIPSEPGPGFYAGIMATKVIAPVCHTDDMGSHRIAKGHFTYNPFLYSQSEITFKLLCKTDMQNTMKGRQQNPKAKPLGKEAVRQNESLVASYQPIAYYLSRIDSNSAQAALLISNAFSNPEGSFCIPNKPCVIWEKPYRPTIGSSERYGRTSIPKIIPWNEVFLLAGMNDQLKVIFDGHTHYMNERLKRIQLALYDTKTAFRFCLNPKTPEGSLLYNRIVLLSKQCPNLRIYQPATTEDGNLIIAFPYATTESPNTDRKFEEAFEILSILEDLYRMTELDWQNYIHMFEVKQALFQSAAGETFCTFDGEKYHYGSRSNLSKIIAFVGEDNQNHYEVYSAYGVKLGKLPRYSLYEGEVKGVFGDEGALLRYFDKYAIWSARAKALDSFKFDLMGALHTSVRPFVPESSAPRITEETLIDKIITEQTQKFISDELKREDISTLQERISVIPTVLLSALHHTVKAGVWPRDANGISRLMFAALNSPLAKEAFQKNHPKFLKEIIYSPEVTNYISKDSQHILMFMLSRKIMPSEPFHRV